jgi:hypothetical protein
MMYSFKSEVTDSPPWEGQGEAFVDVYLFYSFFMLDPPLTPPGRGIEQYVIVIIYPLFIF